MVTLSQEMNRLAPTWVRFSAVAVLGLMGLANASAALAAPRVTSHRAAPKAHSRLKVAKWPRITALKPDSATVNVGPNFGAHSTTPHNPPLVPLVVLGTGFRPGAIVRWNGKPLATKFVSPGRLEASIPDAALEKTAFSETLQAAITVVNPGVKGHTSPPVAFQVDREVMGG